VQGDIMKIETQFDIRDRVSLVVDPVREFYIVAIDIRVDRWSIPTVWYTLYCEETETYAYNVTRYEMYSLEV
jgi:hypothetical protein